MLELVESVPAVFEAEQLAANEVAPALPGFDRRTPTTLALREAERSDPDTLFNVTTCDDLLPPVHQQYSKPK